MSEKEQKLLIIGMSPQNIFKQIIGMMSLGSYTLGPVREVTVTDRYFDTPKLDLKNNHASLRIRQKEHLNPVITLKTKTNAPQEDIGEHDRYEIERDPLENNVLVEMWKMLESVDTNIVKNEFPFNDVVGNMLKALGFQEILSSSNQRIKRPITDANDQEVAELVLDDVVFSGQGKKSGHFYEIEIEAFKEKEKMLEEARISLNKAFPNQLIPSEKSKYERGFDFLQIDVDLRNEYKLRVDGDIDAIINHLRDNGEFAGYPLNELGSRIRDVYLDTSNYWLRDHTCYLRLRSVEAAKELTYRQFTLSEKSSQIIEQVQIKKPATVESLNEISRFLIKQNILAEDLAVDDISHLNSGFRRLGLHEILNAEIERTIFSIVNEGKQVANIKLDKVIFTNPEIGEPVFYNEVEISTDEPNFGTDGIALMFADRYGLSLTYYPKYIVGEHLLRTGEIPKPEGGDALRLIARGEIVEVDRTDSSQPVYLDSINSLVNGVKEHIETSSTMVMQEVDSVDELENKIDSTLRNYNKRNSLMISMAVLVFVFGILVFSVSLYVALQGNVQPFYPIAGMSFGVILNAFILYPFKVISQTWKKEVELSTRASILRVELEHGISDKESRDRLIERAWKGADAVGIQTPQK